jgi:hypothetical protein
MRTRLLTLLVAAALPLGACHISATYDGSRYACAPPPDECPTGLICQDGYCVPPDQVTPDAGPVTPPPDPPDASDVTPLRPPDAGPPAVDVTVTLGEQPTATLQNVTRDTYLRSDYPDDTYGHDTTVAADAAPETIGLLRFDLSGLPPGQVISATLTLHVNDPLESGDFKLFPLLESWSEDTATYNQRKSGTPWTTAGAGPGSRANAPALTWTPRTIGFYDVALPPALVTLWRDAPADNFGLAFVSTSTDGRGGQIDSRDAADVTLRPLLIVVVRQ